MRYYSFFPGCSLDISAAAYGTSTLAVAKALDVELVELDDWNCCGSTPYSSVDELASFCISGRNLSLAEKRGLDLVTPCSSCYIILNRANSYLKLYPKLRAKVDEALAAGGLEYHRNVKVRHLLEVIVNDIGLDAVKAKVKRNLSGLKVASYYGCQLVRPNFGFDDPELPQSLDRLMECLGAEPTPFPLKSRCCGGSTIISEQEVALELIHKLLDCAQNNGAECLVTVCPLCQLNLDAYQGQVNKKFKTNYNLPIFFFTQLMGLALEVEPKALGLEKGVVSPKKVLAQRR